MPEVEAHLGEVIGSIAPMQPIRRVTHKRPRYIEDGTALMLAVVGSTVFTMLVMAGVWIAFTFAGRSPLQ